MPLPRKPEARAREPQTVPRGSAAPGRGPAAKPGGPALRAWVDGGARGNPGPAGYGAYIEDTDGNVVREENGYLGVTTNNVAEYRGLIAALQAAVELEARALDVFADSELMVRQMNGRYRVKNERLKLLHGEATALAARVPCFRINHVRREENREADRLANEAMDRGE